MDMDNEEVVKVLPRKLRKGEMLMQHVQDRIDEICIVMPTITASMIFGYISGMSDDEFYEAIGADNV